MISGARPELLASVEWLADNLGRPDTRVIDARWRPDGTGRQVHAAGHIPGAIHVDWGTELVDAEDERGLYLLAAPEQFAATMSRAGVGDGSTVVVYDDAVSLYAARTWWSLRAYGFDACRILDGGFPAWVDEGRPVSRVPGIVPNVMFTPRAQLRARLTTADVRGLLGSPEVLFIDARAPAEYRGFEGNTRRLGHIPGAVNVPVAATTRPGSQHFRSADQLRSLLLKANVTRGRRLVCYDGSGVAAAKLAFILMLVGHDDVALYDGGWAEWGDRLDLPVDR